MKKLYCEKNNKVPGYPTAIFDCVIGSGSYFLTLLIFMCVINTAFAQNYELPQIDASVSVSDEWAAATDNVKQGDKILEYFKNTPEQMKEMLKSGGMHIMAYNPDIMVQAEITSANAVSTLDFVAEENLIQAFGIDKFNTTKEIMPVAESFRVFNNGQINFICYESKTQYSNLNLINYYTEVNGKGIIVTFKCYSEEISDIAKQKTEEFMKGVSFKNIQEKKEVAPVVKQETKEAPKDIKAEEKPEEKKAVESLPETTPEATPEVKESEKPENEALAEDEPEETQNNNLEKTQETENKKDLSIVYIILVVAAVIIIAGVYFILKKKKNKKL